MYLFKIFAKCLCCLILILSVALWIFCLVLWKLCKPVKGTPNQYKHIELSMDSKTGHHVFRGKNIPKMKIQEKSKSENPR